MHYLCELLVAARNSGDDTKWGRGAELQEWIMEEFGESEYNSRILAEAVVEVINQQIVDKDFQAALQGNGEIYNRFVPFVVCGTFEIYDIYFSKQYDVSVNLFNYILMKQTNTSWRKASITMQIDNRLRYQTAKWHC